MNLSVNLGSLRFHGKKPGIPGTPDEAARAKAGLVHAAKARKLAFMRAQRFVHLIAQARAEAITKATALREKPKVSDEYLANWMNSYAAKKGKKYYAQGGEKWKAGQIRRLFESPDRMIFLAVLECRTLMHLASKRADFNQPFDALDEIEKEYLGYIAEALALEHRLNGFSTRSRDELLEEARYRAIDFVAQQRSEKPLSVTARYLLWDHDPPFVEMAFQEFQYIKRKSEKR